MCISSLIWSFSHLLPWQQEWEKASFSGWVMKGVEMTECLLAESLWMGWAWDGKAQSHLSLLGPLLTLEKSLKLSPLRLPDLRNETTTYLIWTNWWLQTAGWKQGELNVGCDYDGAQRHGPLAHGKKQHHLVWTMKTKHLGVPWWIFWFYRHSRAGLQLIHSWIKKYSNSRGSNPGLLS